MLDAHARFADHALLNVVDTSKVCSMLGRGGSKSVEPPRGSGPGDSTGRVNRRAVESKGYVELWPGEA